MEPSTDYSPATPDASDLGLPSTPGSVVRATIQDGLGVYPGAVVALTSDDDGADWVILNGPPQPDRFVSWTQLSDVVVLFDAEGEAA